MDFKSIVVIGLGYIGLPTAAMFASKKVKVLGVDINQNTVDTINQGKIHIVEPGLGLLVQEAVANGYLQAAVTPASADAFLIAVPTPFKANHQPDLSYIQKAAEAIAPVLKKGNVVILESTSPVGATELVAQWLAALRLDLSFPQQAGDTADIKIAYCPERVLPGQVVRELVENDRIIGGLTPSCSILGCKLYSIFVTGECITTNARTAEMAKLTENASRDVSIAFANELSLIADKLDIDVWELIELANRHPRVNILQPGPGVGGHCIAVDPWFLVSSAPAEAQLIRTARIVNDNKPQWVCGKVESALAAFLMDNPQRSASSIVLACFGLAFKANIDDLRESPAVNITKNISAHLPCKVIAVEPNIATLPAALLGLVELVSLSQALTTADIILLLVDHTSFKVVDPLVLHTKVVIDTRGLWREKPSNDRATKKQDQSNSLHIETDKVSEVGRKVKTALLI